MTFDYEADMTDFIHIVRDSDRNSENAEPGHCQVAFMDGKSSERFECKFDGAWFSGRDTTMYRRVRGCWLPFDGEDRNQICSTMRIIDESDTWLAICRLADALCNQPVAEDGCLSLDGTAINGVIDSVGQARSSEQDGQPE